jgi:hypothetical protein
VMEVRVAVAVTVARAVHRQARGGQGCPRTKRVAVAVTVARAVRR